MQYRWWPAPLLAAAALGSCAGDGSDIGPRLSRLPQDSCRAVVLDDAGRGVVGARVTVVGTTLSALTGRNGRGDFLAAPRGARLLRVDGSAAAAVAGDHLATLMVAQTIVGPDLPAPIYLPDLPDGADAQIPAGTQTATTTLTSPSNATVTVANGISVGTPGGETVIDLRLGELSAQHLPGDVPLSGLGATLLGMGVFISPADATFSPGIDLNAPNDLLASSGTVSLYRLDPDTGEWGVFGTGTVSGGRIVSLAQLTGGGLYAFGVGVTDATVTGQVLDLDIDGAGPDVRAPVPNVMVRVDQRHAITGSDGRFTVTGVARRRADNNGRLAQVELFAGGSWLPALLATSIDVSSGSADFGELELDTMPAGNIRMQQIERARVDPLQIARLSAVRGGVSLVRCGDANGQVIFEDVPFGYYGSQEGRLTAPGALLYSQAIAIQDPGRRWNDLYFFMLQRTWYQGTRNSRAYVCDSIGGGPIFNAAVVQGSVAATGLLGFTQENGVAFADRGFERRVTASVRSERDGAAITHAMSVSVPSSDKVELPLQQVQRAPLGAFDRHGIVAGDLLLADLIKQHELRATRRIFLREWWDDVTDAAVAPLQSRLPVDLVPTSTIAFRAGIDAVGGHLAAIEYSTPGGLRTLEKVGLLLDFTPTEGAVVDRDLALDLTADSTFFVVGLLANAPSQVDTATLQLALALEQNDGRVVDVARELRGNHIVSGADVLFALPPLNGQLLGRRWLVLLSGEKVDAGITYRHHNLIPLLPDAAVALREFPTIDTAPAGSAAPGGTVAASGFPVAFTLPDGAVFGTIELRSEAAGDLLRWSVTVRPEEQGFAFVTLPTDVPTPLVAGRTYTVTVSAWFAPEGSYDNVAYGDLVSFAQTIGPIESGVSQVTSCTLTVTAN